MGKILVSWIATTHDFLKKDSNQSTSRAEYSINENGPHFNLYKDFGDDYDVHYLLSQYSENDNSDPRWEQLAGTLRNRFSTTVVLRYMDIDDLLSVGLIKDKVQELINIYLKEMNVEVFISPGSPTMQIAWHLLASDLRERNNLYFFRRRERKYVKNGGIPPKEPIKFTGSEYSRVSNLRDNYKDGVVPTADSVFITPAYKGIYERAWQLAGNHSTTVLIQGEIGTGKSYLAKFIHENSNRKSKPYVSINCAAHRSEILENRLFGFEAGAFEGAKKLTTGVFEHAKGGTLVIEQIDRLPEHLQVQLAGVLSKKNLRRLGAKKDIPMDVRVIVTTTQDLWKLFKKGDFLIELYHRLSIAKLKLPPFVLLSPKERKDWIEYFMKDAYTRLEKRYIGKIDKAVWDFLLTYPFLGNLLEVKNRVEEFYTFCDERITLDDISEEMKQEKDDHPLLMKEIIKKHAQRVLERCGGVKKQAAQELGIHRTTLDGYLE